MTFWLHHSAHGSLCLLVVPVPGLLGLRDPGFALLKVVTPRNLAAVGEELVELVEQLVDTVRSLQSHLPTLELGPDPELSTLAEVGLAGGGRCEGGAGLRADSHPELKHVVRPRIVSTGLLIATHARKEIWNSRGRVWKPPVA